MVEQAASDDGERETESQERRDVSAGRCRRRVNIPKVKQEGFKGLFEGSLFVPEETKHTYFLPAES